ncbi:hypothetical protein TRICI_006858 [Trichomonascus ciferrii]|uniref:Uncharacterized protein n=1 Tax=Trichomonascus ciferrii TaxID=44093 RepID=A0A642UJC9_9ASCO|nr:hypothetical protein TRICI_006858 [Trichomonascus ciferrii]
MPFQPMQSVNCESDNFDEAVDPEREDVGSENVMMNDDDDAPSDGNGRTTSTEQVTSESRTLPEFSILPEEIEKRKQRILKHVEDPEEAERLAVDQLSKEKKVTRQILDSSIFHRPSNTTRTYAPSKKAYEKWCEENSYLDHEVTESRVLRFLNEEFLEKPEREGKPRKSYNTLVTYVSGLTDLYKQQKMMGQISPANVGIRANGLNGVQKFMDSYQRREAQSDRDSFRDRSQNSLDHGYTPEQFEELMDDALKNSRSTSLQERLQIQLRHILSFRGHNCRKIELCDLSVRSQKPTIQPLLPCSAF